MFSTETDNLTPIIDRFLAIDDVTRGDSRQPFLVRYRGLLRIDSLQAYDQLAVLLRPLNITPQFRKDGDRHVIPNTIQWLYSVFEDKLSIVFVFNDLNLIIRK